MKTEKRSGPDLRRRSQTPGKLTIQYCTQPVRDSGAILTYERRSRDQKVKGARTVGRRTKGGGKCVPPGSSVFEGRALLVQENHTRCDINSRDGTRKKRRNNANRAKKLC